MSDYYIVDGEDLTSVADAIRWKSGLSGELEFPDEFVEAIGDIDGGSEWPAFVDDGKTHIRVEIARNFGEAGKIIALYYYQDATNCSTINWGDGSNPEIVPSFGYQWLNHTYEDYGKYEIIIDINSEFIGKIGGQYSSSIPSICGSPSSMSNYIINHNRLCIKEIGLFSTNFIIDSYAFYDSYGLENVYAHDRTAQCWVKTGNDSNYFYNCYSLMKVRLPNGITTLYNSMIENTCMLPSIEIPSSVTSLENRCLPAAGNGYLKEIHFRSNEPPSVSSGYWLSSLLYTYPQYYQYFKIYVPYSSDHSILNAYKTAEYWTPYADFIYEEPQS